MNAIIDASIVMVLVVAIVIVLQHASAVADLQKRLRRLGRIEAKLDHLMRNAGIEFGPYEGLPAQVVDALNRGDKLEAIKFYCSAPGASFKEAKRFIEDIQRRAGFL